MTAASRIWPAIWVGALSLACGCDTAEPALDAGAATYDASASVPSDLGLFGDGGAALRGAFTIIGCATLTVDGQGPVCSGPAPLSVTFVPLSVAVSTYYWTFEGGTPSSSSLSSPTVSFATPRALGYMVTLVAGGAGGLTSAQGQVQVVAGALADACTQDDSCGDAPRKCICGGQISTGTSADGGSADCPGSLASGLCSESCSGGSCAAGGLCVDLSRGGGGDPYRNALCLPSCQNSSQCRSGLSCRELPVLDPGEQKGGSYHWERGCFADVLADDGAACNKPDGTPDSSACLSGRCDAVGARGVCTSACGHCNAESVCAHFGAQAAGIDRCVRKCDSTFTCDDPFLACDGPGHSGTLAFTVAADLGTEMLCAPRRCTMSNDCGTDGTCAMQDGGTFCSH